MDYKARFYSPYLNRFIQPDSIIPGLTNTQSWNRYSYVNNNPIIYNDPSGHWILLAAILVLAVVDVVWTGVDVYNATQIINDPEATSEEVEAAQLAAFVAVAAAAAEPDFGIMLPLDDIGRLIARNSDEIVETLGSVAAHSADDVVEGSGEIIYRSGGWNPGNLTPGLDEVVESDGLLGGLSFYTSPSLFPEASQGRGWVAVDTSLLDILTARADDFPIGHVTVHPPTLADLTEWATAPRPHAFTTEVKNAIIDRVK